MKIEDALKIAIANAKHTRERMAAEGDEADTIPALVSGWRGGKHFGLGFPKDHMRDDILDLARMFAAGFDCDVIALIFETWYSSLREGNPLTGRDWEAGDMQDLAENHEGREKGWVSDALMVAVVNRAGDLDGETLPFRVSGQRIEWLQDIARGGAYSLGGPMFDKLKAMMSLPTMSVITKDVANTLFPEDVTFDQRRARLDGTLVKVVMGPNSPIGPVSIALTIDPSERERFDVLRKMLPSENRMRPFNPEMN